MDVVGGAEFATIQRGIGCVGVWCSHLGVMHACETAIRRCKFNKIFFANQFLINLSNVSQIDAFEMENYLRDGYRLAQPLNCPDEL